MNYYNFFAMLSHARERERENNENYLFLQALSVGLVSLVATRNTEAAAFIVVPSTTMMMSFILRKLILLCAKTTTATTTNNNKSSTKAIEKVLHQELTERNSKVQDEEKCVIADRTVPLGMQKHPHLKPTTSKVLLRTSMTRNQDAHLEFF